MGKLFHSGLNYVESLLQAVKADGAIDAIPIQLALRQHAARLKATVHFLLVEDIEELLEQN